MVTDTFLLVICLFIGMLQIINVSADSLSKLRLDLAKLEAKFEEREQNLAAERKKADSLMNLVLIKDGYLADLLQGPEGDTGEKGEKGERGERGEAGPPGPPGPSKDLTQLEVRLAQLEKLLRNTAEGARVGQAKILFATEGAGGVKCYSSFSSDVRTVVNTNEDVIGLVWDSRNQQYYYSTPGKIHLKGDHATGSFLHVPQYGMIWPLALDEITGNLYGGTLNGKLFVCKTSIITGEPLNCTTLLTYREAIGGIALNPKDGTMYWTLYNETGYILRGQMDGTNPQRIVDSTNGPGGIVLDNVSGRLFWTEHEANKIKSSNLYGGDLRQILQLSDGTHPWSIILVEGRLYWGNWRNKTLQSCTKSGHDPRVLYVGSNLINQLAFVARNFPPMSRKNDCEGQSCANICVLNSISFRCLD